MSRGTVAQGLWSLSLIDQEHNARKERPYGGAPNIYKQAAAPSKLRECIISHAYRGGEGIISHAYRGARILFNSKSHCGKQTSFTAYIATYPQYFSSLYA